MIIWWLKIMIELIKLPKIKNQNIKKLLSNLILYFFYYNVI